jgi:hypothetical protein
MLREFGNGKRQRAVRGGMYMLRGHVFTLMLMSTDGRGGCVGCVGVHGYTDGSCLRRGGLEAWRFCFETGRLTCGYAGMQA